MQEHYNDGGEPENGEALSREALAAKRVFTTGEAAVVCGLSQQTIIRCFDSGRLTGFKVPGSKFRRIPREELIRFMRTNNLPMEIFQNGALKRVVSICAAPALEEACRGAFSSTNGYDLGIYTDPLLAGVSIGVAPPEVCILTLAEHNTEEAIRRISAIRAVSASMRIMVVGPRHHSAAATKAGADAFTHDHHDPRHLASSLHAAAAALLGVH